MLEPALRDAEWLSLVTLRYHYSPVVRVDTIISLTPYNTRIVFDTRYSISA